ncbi:hypothetical protein EcWSU1_00043 [Enterobacter ludwigii]|uniref:Uncharacterized protein n=1 Tax=Enterobacter ludwigii TaxID=299767 RepID=G8LEW0_9ENTR|nr:hypothetical protein EcWSU1_00043 [Enterobacter ludwigii]
MEHGFHFTLSTRNFFNVIESAQFQQFINTVFFTGKLANVFIAF